MGAVPNSMVAEPGTETQHPGKEVGSVAFPGLERKEPEASQERVASTQSPPGPGSAGNGIPAQVLLAAVLVGAASWLGFEAYAQERGGAPL